MTGAPPALPRTTATAPRHVTAPRHATALRAHIRALPAEASTHPARHVTALRAPRHAVALRTHIRMLPTEAAPSTHA